MGSCGRPSLSMVLRLWHGLYAHKRRVCSLFSHLGRCSMTCPTPKSPVLLTSIILTGHKFNRRTNWSTCIRGNNLKDRREIYQPYSATSTNLHSTWSTTITGRRHQALSLVEFSFFFSFPFLFPPSPPPPFIFLARWSGQRHVRWLTHHSF